MTRPLFHVFRNAPYGRETLLFSAYTCRRLQIPLRIYLPQQPRFLFYFEQDIVQVDLDQSYLRRPETARDNVEALLRLGPPLETGFVEPETFTATGLPDLPTDFGIMACPRSMTKASGPVGLGLIGPKVRRIILAAPFPVLIPPGVYKPWTNLAVLYGGSKLAGQAVRLGRQLADRSQAPLQVISFGDRNDLARQAKEQGILSILEECDWQVRPGKPIREELDVVPHDALLLLGAYGHGPVRSLFGSTMEDVQAELPNPLLVVGPRCRIESVFS
ncbi:nucleotide-binding universal stress UspA family protein [Geothermobacter ehrlichii]|uniref:Nucleotide-binding universal stress UspA family protein n=1 Tax=Geothermobacter ehrlichii TaxID=213224 RepID=A0A5D3WLA8_9BACT|nr:universal stress protein [Geothermobacter ehrlichii]TYO99882.1 nucleotide-binding universal stress UspA family protein [Geothermobacter ehrlichii]